MLIPRLIPVLLLKNEGLVKTNKFLNPKYVGDPINAVKIFNEKEVDEIIIIDINATKDKTGPNFDLIKQITSECFMPLCYGGGIKSIDQASKIFSLGVEKICIQNAAYNDIKFINELSKKFGSQSVVVCIDLKKNWFGKLGLFSSIKKRNIDFDWKNFIKRTIDSGAGEIMINFVDRDGTLSGMDYDTIHEVSTISNVPIIASGGLSSLNDMKSAIKAGASAVSGGAFFVFSGPHKAVLITYPSYNEIKQLFI